MKTGKLWLAGAAVLALSVAALVGAQARGNKPAAASAVVMPKTDRMPMADFKKLLAENNVVVLDVRSSESYQSGHIPGALSVPEETIDANLAEKLKRMGKPIATYCTWQAEHTSARAAQTLQKMGVPAQAIVGGMTTWVEEKNPVTVGAAAR